MSGGITVALVRHLIAEAPWAQARLRPYAGQTVDWDLAGVRGRVRLDPEGLPAACELGSTDGAAPPAAGVVAASPAGRVATARSGVRLQLAAADLPVIGQGFEALMRCVVIEGNAGLASELAFIARNLKPDPAAWLSPWLGDVLAERTDRGLRGTAAWAAATGQRAARAGAEFVVHEARLLPDARRVAEHCRGIDELREAADRLAQRVARLERGQGR